MKTCYKIYWAILDESEYAKSTGQGYAPVRAIQCPEFESESEAESWLKEELGKQNPNNKDTYRHYYFIQKTYIQNE